MQRMHVVIGGYGRVGSYLAHKLEAAGHSVAVIDSNILSFEDDPEEMIGTQLVGTVFDRRILEEAGLDHADVFAAVTSRDNSNFVAARIAKLHYGVPRVIARVYGPQRAEIFEELGIPTVASVVWARARLLALVLSPQLRYVREYGDAELRMFEFDVPAALVGCRVADVEVPGEVRLTAIIREGAPRLPTPEFEFAEGDVVYANALADGAAKLTELLGTEDDR